MSRPPWTTWLLAASLFLVSAWPAAVGDQPAGRPAPNSDREYAALAARWRKSSGSFEALFARLCAETLARADRQTDRPLADQVRAMMGGLWLWAVDGGDVTLQGRRDWALHFIGGAAFEGYWDLGTTAGLIKEQRDSRMDGNDADLDDLAATLLGARWMRLAAGTPAAGAAWVAEWASGRRRLSRDLPVLRWGTLPRGEQVSEQNWRELRVAVDRALAFAPSVVVEAGAVNEKETQR